MAHTHDDVHRDVEIIDRDGSGSGMTAGLMVAIAAILVFAVIALAVLFARPWDDNNSTDTTPNVPGISDNSGGTGGGGDTGGGGGTSGDAPAAP